MEAGGSKGQLLSMLPSKAVDALSGTRYAIADAIDHVPPKPGLYAVYADPETWQELNLGLRRSRDVAGTQPRDTRGLPTVRR
jgi:hypothetical protein